MRRHTTSVAVSPRLRVAHRRLADDSVRPAQSNAFLVKLICLLMISAFACNAARAQSTLSSQSRGVTLELSLPEAIALALSANRAIQSAYLGRVSEEYALRVAEDRFRPDLNLIAGGEIGRSGDRLTRTSTNTAMVSPQVSMLVPTGGAFAFTWANQLDELPGGATDHRSGLDISFVQPLLRGAGLTVNRAPVRIARMNERINVLNLKATINRTITDVVTAYRELLLEERQLDIAERSLTRARALLETNRAMINAGRMARQDIIQTEADVSQRELDFLSAQNTIETARLVLINVLDIDPETQLRLTEPLRLEEIGDLDFETAFEHALANQPFYLQALLQSEISALNVRTAKNERLWRLDATVSASFDGNSTTGFGTAFDNLVRDPVEYRAGLRLTIPFGDLRRKQGVVDAKIAHKQQELGLVEIRENIRIDIKDRVRTVASLRQQVSLAERAAELAAQQLDVENLKLSQGRSANFQVLDFENQLISAQINAATATVSYLNALTLLDEALGTTMETWRIPFKASRYETPDVPLFGESNWEVQP